MIISVSYNDELHEITINEPSLLDSFLQQDDKGLFIKQLLMTGFSVSKCVQPSSSCGCCYKIDELSLLMKPFNTGGNSCKNGQIGEVFASTLFKKRNPHIAYYDTAKIDKSGDAIITVSNHTIDKIMIDYKNYDSPVPSEEVTKLVRDLKAQNIKYGIIISYKSKISKRNYIDYVVIEGKLIVFVASYGLDIFTLEMSIQYIQRLHECNTLSISDKVTDLVSKEVSKEINDIHEHLYELSCEQAQNINNIKEHQEKMNKMFYSMIGQALNLQTSMNLLVDKSEQLSKDIYKEPLSTTQTYTELIECVDRIIDKEKDKLLSKRILNITRDLSINGSHSEVDNCIHFTPYGKLQITKSKITMIFYNNYEGECSFNHKYESIKNDNFHIILSDDPEKWKIIEHRFCQN